MFKNNINDYIRIILRTKSSYRIMDKIIDKIEDRTQRNRLRSQLDKCNEDCDTLINELKKHGHL